MENRAQIWKPGDFSLGQVHEFMGAFGRVGGNPALLQIAIESQEKMRQIVSNLGGSPVAEEEKESGYPQGFRIRTVQKQLKVLIMLFPNLDASYVKELASGELPEGAEGWAVIPKPEKIGTHFGTYHEVLEKVTKLIAKDREFNNLLEDKLSERYLHLTEKTKQAHANLKKQTGDFWVFPFQFGKKWAGHSASNAKVHFADNEFGLGPYEEAILLLTHPDRITGSKHLYVDCAGCEYIIKDGPDPYFILRFHWVSGYERLTLNYYKTDYVSKKWGVASGFLPK
ncbi:MAG: hypothetical protein NTX00_05500 [Candidatus Parcubacteria bacterium]|nr:hypothetical protein [Candidatus Parcubacteria bacterium]